jgi:DNA-binding IclR family transcriptional regulator
LEQSTADLIVDYVRRAPAAAGNVASHFGMRLSDAYRALVDLEDTKRIEPHGRYQWRIADGRWGIV